MLTWDPCDNNEKNEFQFWCVEFLVISLLFFTWIFFVGFTHSHTHPFSLDASKQKSSKNKKGPKSHDLMVKFLDPQPRGEHRKGPRFPVIFFMFFSVEGGLMKFFLPIQNFPKPPGFSFGRNLKSEENTKSTETWGSEWKFRIEQSHPTLSDNLTDPKSWSKPWPTTIPETNSEFAPENGWLENYPEMVPFFFRGHHQPWANPALASCCSCW